jgi:uncharacterized protein
MNTMQRSQTATSNMSLADENARFMAKVYKWMSFGIALTGFVAYRIGSDEQLAMQIVSNQLLFWGLVIAQLGAVFFLAARIQKMKAMTATAVYLGYTALTGVTLSVIFLIYTQGSIAQVFMITSFAFMGLSIFGYVTKRDLGPVGSFCMMGLWGMVGFGLITIFFPSLMTDTMSKVYGIVGLVVFSGLTAYDTQKIKKMNIIGNEGTAEDHKEAIHGALTLYLDFINLFLSLLRLMGKRR